MKFDYDVILNSITIEQSYVFLAEMIEWEPDPLLRYKYEYMFQRLHVILRVINSK